MTAPYRADQVGSFLRPPALLEARHDPATRPERLRELEDRAILEALARQRELGFEIFTDGELRRSNFMSDFWDAVSGLDHGDAVARMWQVGGPGSAHVSRVTGIVTQKLRQLRRLTAHELPFLKRHSPGAIKVTLPSATQFPAIAYKRGVSDRVVREPVRVPVGRRGDPEGGGAGARRRGRVVRPDRRATVQLLHGPQVARLDPHRDGPGPGRGAGRGRSARTTPAWRASRRPGVTLAIHLCRGNNRSHWYAEGGYDPIAEKLFTSLQVDRFLLEYDDARSGTFEPLRFVPRGKTVVLGLVSSKLPRARVARRAPPAHRGRGAPRPAGRPGALAAVRLRLDDGGQSPHGGRPVGQARPGREGRPRGLGLSGRPGRVAPGGAAREAAPASLRQSSAARGASSRRHRGLGARMDGRRPVGLPESRSTRARRP